MYIKIFQFHFLIALNCKLSGIGCIVEIRDCMWNGGVYATLATCYWRFHCIFVTMTFLYKYCIISIYRYKIMSRIKYQKSNLFTMRWLTRDHFCLLIESQPFDHWHRKPLLSARALLARLSSAHLLIRCDQQTWL